MSSTQAVQVPLKLHKSISHLDQCKNVTLASKRSSARRARVSKLRHCYPAPSVKKLTKSVDAALAYVDVVKAKITDKQEKGEDVSTLETELEHAMADADVKSAKLTEAKQRQVVVDKLLCVAGKYVNRSKSEESKKRRHDNKIRNRKYFGMLPVDDENDEEVVTA